MNKHHYAAIAAFCLTAVFFLTVLDTMEELAYAALCVALICIGCYQLKCAEAEMFKVNQPEDDDDVGG